MFRKENLPTTIILGIFAVCIVGGGLTYVYDYFVNPELFTKMPPKAAKYEPVPYTSAEREELVLKLRRQGLTEAEAKDLARSTESMDMDTQRRRRPN